MIATPFAKLNIAAETLHVAMPLAGKLQISCWIDSDADGQQDAGEMLGVGKTIVITPANGGEPVTLSSDSRGLAEVVLPAGDYQVTRKLDAGYRLSNTDKGFILVTVKAGETAKVNLPSTNRPLPKPEPAAPAVIRDLGCCIWEADIKDAKVLSALSTLKPQHVRYFESPCVRGKGFNLDNLQPAATLVARGIDVITMCGLTENETPSQSPDEDDIAHYFLGIAQARAHFGLGANHIVELLNELNLAKYCRSAASNGAVVSDAACKLAVTFARIAREQLGPDAIIYGPSIGWNAATQPHVAYWKRMLDFGIGKYINAINSHLYPNDPAMISDLFGLLRGLANDNGLRLVCTECTLGTESGLTDQQIAVKITDIRNRLATAGVESVSAYRVRAVPTSSRNRVCLTDENGVIRPAIASAWGFKSN